VADTPTNLHTNKASHNVILPELEKLPEGQVAFVACVICYQLTSVADKSHTQSVRHIVYQYHKNLIVLILLSLIPFAMALYSFLAVALVEKPKV
jgi:hypothetical protein